MARKNIILSCLVLVVLVGISYAIYIGSTSPNSLGTKDGDTAVEEKITGQQSEGKDVQVYSAVVTASPANYSLNSEVIEAGYKVSVQVRLNSSKKMQRVAIEGLHIDNQLAVGDCTISEKEVNVGNYSDNAKQIGNANFKMTCRTGVTYTLESVLSTGESFTASKLLSYGGLTPSAISRSLSFDVAVKFDDGTITKKAFRANINGSVLSVGGFSAGTINGEKDVF